VILVAKTENCRGEQECNFTNHECYGGYHSSYWTCADRLCPV